MSQRRKRLWARVLMLALLPTVLLAMVSYARSVLPGRSVVGVDSAGRRVIYSESIWDPLWHLDPSARSPDYIVLRQGHHEIRKAVPGMLRFAVALCCNQQSLAAAERDGRIAIYDTQSLQVLRSGQVLPEPFEVLELTFSRNGRYVAVSGRDRSRSQRNAADSAHWPYLYVVIDANTLEVTQQLGPREFFRKSGGAPHRVVLRKSLVGNTPAFSEGQIMEFERGSLEPIASAPGPPRTCYSANLRFACDSSRSPQFVIWDRQNGTSRTMTIPSSRYPLFAPRGDRLVVISVTDQISVFDPETATIVSSWKLDGDRAGEAAFSPDGRLVAIATDVSEIEVWDVASGTRRAKFSDAIVRHRTLGAMAVLSATLWCMVWMAIGWREPRTPEACRDVLMVSAVAAIGFFLRLVLGGHQGIATRPAAIGTLTVFIGSSTLVAIWLVFGSGRWSLRLSAAVAVLAVIWAGPVWAWNHLQLPENVIVLGGVTITLVVGLLMVWLRRWGFAIVREPTPVAGDLAARRSVQMPLRDLMMLPAAVGLAVLVAKWAPVPTGMPWWTMGPDLLTVATQGLIVTLALWVALSRRSASLRCSIGLVGTLMLSTATPLAFHGWPLLPFWWYVVAQSAIGAHVCLSMHLVRRCGWRLQRPPCLG